ncbi:outer membrane lipoprotein-sorting protein [Alkalimonas collagenimarina]|uniref:Outer membrane lipoprotein-sorting protein n=1 Tax=Alkalimonas collagenimarina TaxID=400390 RepID=A0ABT9GVP2_9GAMM|nr:outer membrane lipoprotein-sorting protein [Alkalimonas collagenimarina]MDP4535117.1 outer membrane lipoprotein-sorting protein [Alkalimonas collagenimarina]
MAKFVMFYCLLFAQVVIADTSAQAEVALSKAQQIIAYIDKGRAADSPFEVRLDVTRTSEQKSFSYRLVDDGKSRSILYFLDKDQRGQKVLATEDETWFFSNRTRRAIKIPAAQTLFGDASIGDIARIRFAADYTPISLAQDGEHYILSLNSTHPAATYQRVIMTVRRADSLPLQAEFFAASGRHMKTARFTRVSVEQDIPVFHEWELFTPGNEQSVTIVRSSHFQEISIPAVAFTKSYLELMAK